MVERMSETVVVSCRLCLAWRGPFIMPPSAHVCTRDVRARVAALVCDKATIHVFACTLYVYKCRCVCVCVCVCVCARVHVALHTCPLAMASLNISLTSNIICTVGLNWPTHTDKRPAHTHKQHQEKPRWHVHNEMTKLELCPANYTKPTLAERVIWRDESALGFLHACIFP